MSSEDDLFSLLAEDQCADHGTTTMVQETHAELARVQGAVASAVEYGILREEVQPNGNCPPAYIISSSHLLRQSETDPPSKEVFIRSQAQLFRFMHLLERSNARSPVYCEGWCLDYSVVNPYRALVSELGPADLFTFERQQALFEDEDALVTLIQHLEIISRQRGISAPNFTHLSTYPTLLGAFGDQLIPSWKRREEVHREMQALVRRYHACLLQGTRLLDENGVRDILRNHASNVVSSDCSRYLELAQGDGLSTTVFEVEIANIMAFTKQPYTPLAFQGLSHSFRIASLLRTQGERTPHILTPTASVERDYVRSEKPPEEADSWAIFFRTLLNFVSNI
jgi:hypothetical protein